MTPTHRLAQPVSAPAPQVLATAATSDMPMSLLSPNIGTLPAAQSDRLHSTIDPPASASRTPRVGRPAIQLGASGVRAGLASRRCGSCGRGPGTERANGRGSARASSTCSPRSAWTTSALSSAWRWLPPGTLQQGLASTPGIVFSAHLPDLARRPGRTLRSDRLQ